MFQGKTKAALRLLSDQSNGGVLHLDDQVEEGLKKGKKVRDILIEKHPPGQPVHPNTIINEDPPDILFESLDAAMIRSAALKTSGCAGPSGLDSLACIPPMLVPCLNWKTSLYCPSRHYCTTNGQQTDCPQQEPWCSTNWDRGHSKTHYRKSDFNHH